VEVRTCRQMENYPKFTTIAGAQKYIAYVQARVARPGLSLRLSELMQQLVTDMTADLDGIGSTSQVTKDAAALTASCARAGVDS